ncbi:MAG: hypothetical protein ACLU80_14920 [Dorea sp.]
MTFGSRQKSMVERCFCGHEWETKYKGSFQWREMPHMLRCESDRGN